MKLVTIRNAGVSGGHEFVVPSVDARDIQNIRDRVGILTAVKATRWLTGCYPIEALHFVRSLDCSTGYDGRASVAAPVTEYNR